MLKNEEIKALVDFYQVQANRSKNDVWNEIEQKIDSQKKAIAKPFYREKWFSMAASFLLLVSFSIYFAEYHWNKNHYFANLSQKTITLKDSTTVVLNPKSKLMVNYSFLTGKRRLELQGEALFTVNRGEPFMLNFPGGKVRVLGTVFRVNAYSSEKAEVYCLEGRVEIKSNKENKILTEGKGVKISGQKIIDNVKSKNEVLRELNGHYNWKNEPLYEIFQTLENRFNFTVVTKKNILSRKFTGSISVDSLKNTCETIALAMNLNYSIDKDKKIITFETRD